MLKVDHNQFKYQQLISSMPNLFSMITFLRLPSIPVAYVNITEIWSYPIKAQEQGVYHKCKN